METEAQLINEALPAVVGNATTETDSPAPSTTLADFTSIDLTNLPKRLTDTQLAQVQRVASLPLPQSSPSSDRHYLQCMRGLDILPRRAEDGLSGKLRLNLYRAKLGGFSEAALSHLVDKGLEQFKFFPTISECMTFLRHWPNAEIAKQVRSKARAVAEAEWQARMDDALNLMSKRELTDWDVEKLPEQWKLVAETRGYLWAWPNGRYTVRKDTERMTDDERSTVRAEIADMRRQWDEIREGAA